MKNIENKKISVSLLIFSTLHILVSYVNRVPNRNYKWMYNGKPRYVDQPISNYDTNLLIFPAALDFTILFLTFVLGISIYCFLFKTDEEIRGFTIVLENKIINLLYKIKKFFLSSLKYIDLKYIVKALIVILGVITFLGFGIYILWGITD